jgi:methyl-accepting chemotaxis protein
MRTILKLKRIGLGVVVVTLFIALNLLSSGDVFSKDKGKGCAGCSSAAICGEKDVQGEVDKHLETAEKVIDALGGVSIVEGSTIHWDAINQYSHKATHIDLPKMMVGDKWLGQNSSFGTKTMLVDEVTDDEGYTVTVFQRMNEVGDMLRVATNVEKHDGTRAIGTYIPAIDPDGKEDPVTKVLLTGETFRGMAFVVNEWYTTAYKPLKDGDGNIFGVIYVGVKVAEDGTAL